MAADIYGASAKLGGIFKGTSVALVLGGGGEAAKGSLVQNVNISYTRNINRIWELGSEDTYFIIGHSEGQAQMSQIHGKSDTDILDKLGDACKALESVLTLDGRASLCEGDATFKLVMQGPVVTNRTFAVEAGQFVFTKQAALMFSGLSKSE